MSDSTFTILAVPGSLRKSSYNRALLVAAQELVPDGVSVEIFDGMGELPHFSADREGEQTPPEVHAFRDRIRDADALLFATPEYNSSFPGVLKNATDWASRPPGESVLTGKPAAVIGASPSRYGAVRAQGDLRKVLSSIGAEVLDAELAVSRVDERFDDEGRLVDEVTRRELRGLIASRPCKDRSQAYARSLLELAGKRDLAAAA